MKAQRELVILSHLPWDFVWQRPQHLISRIGCGFRTWFIEEPKVLGVAPPSLRVTRGGPGRRVWLEVAGEQRLAGFDDPAAVDYQDLIVDLLGSHPARTVWIYTPLALPIARALEPELLVYDVMDDLAAFAHASAELRERQGEALQEADLVFTGGRSLDAGVRPRAREKTFLFASGVEPEHYATAREMRRARERRVAGYVGVIDERLDLKLLGELAHALPDWDLQIVGPVFKIDPASLPQAPNLFYPGQQPYERLPEIMAGFDVALMPFALNDSTRSISPTKTLEYLAAGLPVVSTPIPDVVAAYEGIVDLQDSGVDFAAACRRVLDQPVSEREARVRLLLRLYHWDTIAARMRALIEQALDGSPLFDAPPVNEAEAALLKTIESAA